MKYYKDINTVIGKVRIIEEDGYIIELQINKDFDKNEDILEKDTNILKNTERQLSEYFSGQRNTFDLKLNSKGTDFMKKVWRELLNIPYGETRTYKEIAEKIGNPKGARAVGMANNKNPIPIIIPCHRVIGKNKKLVGYALGLDMKEFLLNLERKNKKEI